MSEQPIPRGQTSPARLAALAVAEADAAGEAPPWFALRVRPQHEKAAALCLSERGLETFLPLYETRRRWSDRIKPLRLPLFPGYLFARVPRRMRALALSAPGVLGWVSFGNGPAPVPEEQIASLRRMVVSGLPLEPWPPLQAGRRVRIVAGPLAGLAGTLLQTKAGGCRVVVSVWLLQRAVAIEVERQLVAAADGPATACAAGGVA